MEADLLKKIPIFKGLSPQDFEKLGTILEEKEFPAKHRLFSTGDPSDAFYIVKSGSVRILQEDGDQETELATLTEGQFFGEMGVIEGSERMAAAVIAEDAALFEIEAHEFHRFMAINPNISMKIMSTMSKRYKVKSQPDTARSSQGRSPGQVVSIFSATGGVGNSLVIANLAAAIRKATGQKVAVLDLDLMFGDQTGIFDVKGANSLSAIVEEPEIGMDTLEHLVETSKVGVDLIPAPLKAIEAESVTPGLVGVVLEVLRGAYDWVLVDTANSVSELNLTIFEATDHAIYLMSPEVLAIKNARRWLSILELIDLDLHDLKLVLNKELQGDVSIRDDIEKSLGFKILTTLPFQFKTARNSLNRGQLVVEESPESPLGQALLVLASRLTGVEIDTPSEEPKGLWDRLTNWG